MNRRLDDIFQSMPNMAYLKIDRHYAIADYSENIASLIGDRKCNLGEDVRSYFSSVSDLQQYLDRLLLGEAKQLQFDWIDREQYVQVTLSMLANHGSQDASATWLAILQEKTEEYRHRQHLEFYEKHHHLLEGITQKMRQSLGKEKILQYAVTKLQTLLQADRAFVYYLNPDWSGTVFVEAVSSNDRSLLEEQMERFYAKEKITLAQQHQVQAFTNLEQANLTEPDREALRQLQVNAEVIIPIEQGIALSSSSQYPPLDQYSSALPITSRNVTSANTYLWGLLVIHHSHRPHWWQPWEIQLLQGVASQLSIAIQQSILKEQLEEANEELRQIAACDSLTKLWNHRYFDRNLSQEWRRLTRERSPLSTIVCEIDGFQLYRETYGHLRADFCLQLLADAIHKTLKRPADLVARYGSETFALLLPHTNLSGALHVARLIQDNAIALELEHRTSPVAPTVTLSIGVASLLPRSDLQSELLVELAYHALHQAQRNGCNQIVTALPNV
ncbi:sensor domain-containing diguanylate cyclase [Roseofilum casamattae]|uniref:Diguanylate cyclase n=1 Tax=Roseofilum casamattae BLCC-M143 TaxID=3022442 RepID=A0ABT7BYR4_9CYAN|nr:diguanylate cyclase [Roseofilum casamattae]MDJ1183591.1 diguanylate cyclase [Roseofilum casamattae BLCC-M143]